MCMYAEGGRLAPSSAYRPYVSPPARSLKMTAPQSVSAAGLTHTSRVMADVKLSDAELLTVTQLFTPLNDSAWPPNRPGAQVALAIVPLLLRPDESVRPRPLPSLKPYSATSPARLVGWYETET